MSENEKGFNELKAEQLKTRLKEKGLKITIQRLLVLRVLSENEGEHLTAEEIFDKTCELHPGIGLATVYRTIQLLTQLGLVDRINLDDGSARYEINDADEENGKHHRHHHLICLNCGKIIPFEKDLLEELERNVSETTGFQIVDHEVRLYGYCSDCAGTVKKKDNTEE
ncbi:Fur family transcriptional regulator [Lachnospiraceae bacterium C1.1]|nr:Fur family transcriptional regulator [Lachnospiraceae bacterium C1.1]